MLDSYLKKSVLFCQLSDRVTAAQIQKSLFSANHMQLQIIDIQLIISIFLSISTL